MTRSLCPMCETGLLINRSQLINPTLLSGSDHSSEIPYVMGYPLIRHNPDVRDQTGLEEFPDYPWTEEDDEWAYFIIKLWTNFAKYG